MIHPVIRAAMLGQTPAPALPVVTMSRHLVETALAELAAANPLRSLVIELRAALVEPEEPLWCAYSSGPGDVFPMFDLEDAQRTVADFNAHMVECAAREQWTFVPSMVVIPSPYTPSEHYQVMAEQARDDIEDLRHALEQVQAKTTTLEATS